jgi:hypothetical protein
MVRKIRLVPFGKKPAFPILTTYRYKGKKCGRIKIINLFKPGSG